MTIKQLLAVLPALSIAFSLCRAETNSPSYIPLDEIASLYGFPGPVITNNQIALTNQINYITFETNGRKLVFNNVLIWLNNPVIRENNAFKLSDCDAGGTLAPLLKPEDIPATASPSIIVIDPGHGGEDPGAIGPRNSYEKKFTLAIAKQIKRKLKLSGLTVKLTRSKDVTLSLPERVALTKKANADIFISIHINSAGNTNASGLETYVIPPHGVISTAGNNGDATPCPGNKYDKSNILLAFFVHKGLLSGTQAADRGIRRARFDVLKDAPCPAILTECGFISNRTEEEKMMKKQYRNSIAEGITCGILTYVSAMKLPDQSQEASPLTNPSETTP